MSLYVERKRGVGIGVFNLVLIKSNSHEKQTLVEENEKHLRDYKIRQTYISVAVNFH